MHGGGIVRFALWLLSLAVVAGALFGAYRYGRHVEGLERDSARLERVERGIESGNKLAKADHGAASTAAKQTAARAASASQRTGRVEQGITRSPDYTACALGEQDLQELNDALEGK